MAVVSNSLQLKDAMTPVLKQIVKALDSTLTAMASVDKVATREFDNAQNAIRRASEQVEQFRETVQSTNNQGSNSQKKFTKDVADSSTQMDSLINKAKTLLATYLGFQSIKALVNLSDEYAGINSRLNLILDNNEKLDVLQEKIRQSANRTGSSYKAVADSIAKMKMMAGNAFTSNDELIYFMEQMNKQLAITGVKGAQAESVMYNMTQAMSSGVLRGNDFFILSQNMGGYLNGLQKYLGVSRAELKKMAEEGKITADVMKGALYQMASGEGGTDAQFAKIPYQWGNIWAITINNIEFALQGLLSNVNQMFNSPVFLAVMTNVEAVAISVINTLTHAFTMLGNIGQFIYNNWSMISPIIYGLTAIIGGYNAALIAMWTWQKLVNIATLAGTIVKMGYVAITRGQAVATRFATQGIVGQTMAQWGLNAAILACPTTWIIAGIIALIAIIAVVIAAIIKFSDTTHNAMGLIVGSISAAGAFIWNIFAGLINGLIQLLWTNFVAPSLSTIEFWINVFNGGFNNFGDACKNLIGNIISWFLQLGTVVTKIIDAIFGTDWTSGLNNLSTQLQSWGKNEKAVTLAKEAPAPLKRLGYKDSFNKGAEVGDKWGKSLGGLTDSFKIGTKDAMKESGFDPSTVKSLASNAADTSKSSKKTADKLSEGINISDEDVELLKETARISFVNRFTTMTPQITATFGDVHETADTKAIMGVIEQSVIDALESNLT